MNILSETAFAKINLALHVRSRGADGYHTIETLFAFAVHGDVLVTTYPGEGRGPAPTVGLDPGLRRGTEKVALHIAGPFADLLSAGDNLVTRAAHGFAETFAVDQPIAFQLEKNLPVTAGIGGGSADAGAALRLLARRHGVALDDPRLLALAATLGADVPACLTSRATRGEGRGDRLTPIPATALSGMPLLLVNPRVPLATPDVFRGWDGIDRGPLGDGDPLAAALAGRNDLEAPARRLRPVIGDVLEHLTAQPGALLVRMSGSGATCFALFESDAARDAADRAIGLSAPGWWRLDSKLR